MKCPKCGAKISKNGFRNGIQLYRCKNNHAFNENTLFSDKYKNTINKKIEDEYIRFKERKSYFDKDGMLILPPSVRKIV